MMKTMMLMGSEGYCTALKWALHFRFIGKLLRSL
jgi:hypothetical protein